MRSKTKNAWKYIGCSDQSVPSLSKVAMRSGIGTKSGEPGFVTLSTKAMMACFGAVSFQDGKRIRGKGHGREQNGEDRK